MKRIIILISKNIVILISLVSLFFYRFNIYTEYDRIIFLDVGQGDATFIQYKGLDVLIDGGPDDSVVYKLSEYMPPWDREIDLVILTHPHGDHIEGINDILKRYEVGKILVNKVFYSRHDWLMLVQYDKVEHIFYGKKVILDKDLMISFLWPELDKKGLESNGFYSNFDSNINNDSLIFSVEIADYRVFFSGDAEINVERELLNKGVLEDVDILQAGHHCSNTSSSKEFLQILEPELVVCSLGEENKFNHPGRKTLLRFQDLNIRYLRTDREGDIILEL